MWLPVVRPLWPPEGLPSAAVHSTIWILHPLTTGQAKEMEDEGGSGGTVGDQQRMRSTGGGAEITGAGTASEQRVAMDASVSSQLDGSLNDSVTDGEENHSEASSSPVSVAEESPGVTVVQLPHGETAQVQGVIQAPQTSVIQSPQIATVAELESDESVRDARKRREILSRRPSYRKILNELSTDSPAVPKIDEEKTEEEEPASNAAVSSAHQTSSRQYIAIAQGRAIQLTSPGLEALQGGQTLTVAGSPTPQPGATIVQCAAQPGTPPQQFYIQGGQMLIQGRAAERQKEEEEREIRVTQTGVKVEEWGGFSVCVEVLCCRGAGLLETGDGCNWG
ncbi:hypothetical protein Q5P01_022913 [Channa striata]|uniref:KID domain-containing protein n=1 Tax=Channa striata TaxID=64152 RepID=A0AA88RXV5_CHASR|nr:hypothetical protein Q5P01_022913 [Channa striata]